MSDSFRTEEPNLSKGCSLSPQVKYAVLLGFAWWDLLSDALLFKEIIPLFPPDSDCRWSGCIDCSESEYGCVAPWIIFFSFIFTAAMHFFKAIAGAIHQPCHDDADVMIGQMGFACYDSPLIIMTIILKPNVMRDFYNRYDEVEKDYQTMYTTLLLEDIPSIAATGLILSHSGGNFFAYFSLAASVACTLRSVYQIRKGNQ